MTGGRFGMLAGDMLSDGRVAVRSLAKRPGLALAVILTLGVGIAANVSMFSVVNLALFRALPYRAADELVIGRSLWPDGAIGSTSSAPDYYDLRDQATSFQAIGAITPFTGGATLTGFGEAERVPLAWASPGFFGTLGVAPAEGREFRAVEGEPGGTPVVIVSHGFWQRRLGGRTDVVGSTIVLNGTPTTVVGIMPQGFAFQNQAELWAPMVRGEGYATKRQFHNWLIVARLAPGATLNQAQTEVDVIMHRLAAQYPETNTGMGMVIAPLRDTMIGGFRPSMLILMSATALVLLIACSNVASLLLNRASARSTEMAVRSALGANRARLVRQLLTESAVLGLGAGIFGTAVALVVQQSLVAVTPLVSLGLDAAGTQPAVLMFALFVSVGTVVVFGLAPALTASRVDLSGGLKSASRSVAGGRGRVQDLLVMGQVALSVVLLVGAGLLVRSFVQLRGVDPGFDAHGLLTASLSLPRTTYPEPAERSQFFDALLQRARGLPGVNGAAMISALPVRAPGNNIGVWDPSHPPADSSHLRLAYQRVVKPGYFQVMRIPIRRGRDIASTDGAESRPVVVITEGLAETLFPGQDPLGRAMAVDNGNPGGARFDIVGIVGDVHMSSLDDDSDQAMYFSFEQRPQYTMELAVRAAAPAELARPLRAALANLDPDIPLQGVRTMDAVLADSLSSPRVMTSILTAFAGVALLLAALGLYGVLAYYVTRRQREIGIRMALGARAGDVFRLVLGRGFSRVGVGLVLGVIGSLAVTRLLQTLLFHVTATDPATFLGVTAFFSAVATVACLLPAWRAMRVDPAEAFRTE